MPRSRLRVGAVASAQARAARARRRRRPGPVAVPAVDERLPAPPRGAGGDARRRAADSLRRADGSGRLRHARRPGRRARPRRSKLTADSLLAFQRDLEARGIADRVLVHVWSEFGRRGARTARTGPTTAAAASAAHRLARPGQHDRRVPRARRRARRSRATSPSADFRAVYCAILEQWFDTDAAAIIPGAASFARPALLR